MPNNLFDAKNRTRTDPMRAGENDFAFYDSSARPEYDVYRALLNQWILELPEEAQPETISRLRRSDSAGYQATLAELAVHAALVRQGYSIEIHPLCPHSNYRPDFLVRTREGDIEAFVEITTFGPSSEKVAGSNREAAIYNAIDRVSRV